MVLDVLRGVWRIARIVRGLVGVFAIARGTFVRADSAVVSRVRAAGNVMEGLAVVQLRPCVAGWLGFAGAWTVDVVNGLHFCHDLPTFSSLQ